MKRPPVIYDNETGKKPGLYRILERIVWRVFPKYELHGTENLPEEPCVIVGNHCQMYGPVAAEFHMPRKNYTWCVGEMMDRKEVPAYAMEDFWYLKPKALRWLYRIFGHLIAPLFELVFTNAHTIPVYHDMRIVQTIRKSIGCLDGGADVVIFPECREPYNGILWQFQQHFADLGLMYYRKTGKTLFFVPVYIAAKLKRIDFGEPVRYDPDRQADEERERICGAMKETITNLATALPPHRVVPYPNFKKRDYPLNTDCEDRGNRTDAK